jgi:hypothetical protein
MRVAAVEAKLGQHVRTRGTELRVGDLHLRGGDAHLVALPETKCDCLVQREAGRVPHGGPGCLATGARHNEKRQQGASPSGERWEEHRQ